MSASSNLRDALMLAAAAAALLGSLRLAHLIRRDTARMEQETEHLAEQRRILNQRRDAEPGEKGGQPKT